MGVLVNPLGWRLGSNRVWKINFSVVDDTKYGVLANNLNVGRQAVMGLLERLNKKFFFSGLLRFRNSILYLRKNTIFLFIYFRINLSAVIRFKTQRRYKYYRKERPVIEGGAPKFSRWIKLSLWKIKVYLRRIRNLKKEIAFMIKYVDYIKNKIDRKKLKEILKSKKRRRIRTIWALENLKSQLLAPPYREARIWTWSRNARIWMFLSRKPNKAAPMWSIFRRPYLVWNSRFIKLSRYTFGRKRNLKFYNRITGIQANRAKRSIQYIPHYSRGIYLDHEKFATRLFWLRRRRLKNVRKTKLKGYLEAKEEDRRWYKYFIRRRRRRWKRNHYWKRMERVRKRRVYMLLQQRKRMGDSSPLWELSSWRIMPSLKDSMIFLPSIRATFYFFKIMPFLSGLKLICEKYLESIFASVYEREIYLMNMSKPNAIDAGVILHFVEVFLRRRRRVTKINKLFYRLIKILRFFRGKYRLKGFKFLLAGRFLRRDRATFIWRTRGAVPLGTKLAKIDFATRSMQMKYSRPIAKLWICRR